MIFFVFRLCFFKKEKKDLLYIEVFLHSVIVQNEPLNKVILMLKAKQMFFEDAFMVIRLKYFHDSLNIVVILAPGREFLSA